MIEKFEIKPTPKIKESLVESHLRTLSLDTLYKAYRTSSATEHCVVTLLCNQDIRDFGYKYISIDIETDWAW